MAKLMFSRKHLQIVSLVCAVFAPALAQAAEPAIAPSDIDPRVYDPRAEAHLTLAELERRAAGGDMKAQAEMGARYGSGQGVKQDIPKAIELLKAAVAKNDADAQFFLGTAYSNGLGVPQSDAQAVILYGDSAEQGNPAAELALANALIAGRGGLSPDIHAGLRYMWDSAAKGYPPAMIQMGQYFHDGKGVDPNPRAAAYWYRRALQLYPDVRTIFNLRLLIERRQVVWEPGDPGDDKLTPLPSEIPKKTASDDAVKGVDRKTP